MRLLEVLYASDHKYFTVGMCDHKQKHEPMKFKQATHFILYSVHTRMSITDCTYNQIMSYMTIALPMHRPWENTIPYLFLKS